jgi:hypothetical protein
VPEGDILGAQEGQERRIAQSGHPYLWYGRISPHLPKTSLLSPVAPHLFDVMSEGKNGEVGLVVRC